MDFLSAIKSIAGEECIFCNEMMSDHTTFKVGGPLSKEELDKALDPKEMLQSHKFTLK